MGQSMPFRAWAIASAAPPVIYPLLASIVPPDRSPHFRILVVSTTENHRVRVRVGRACAIRR